MRRFNTTAVCGWRAALAGCGPATTLLEAGHALASIAANIGIKDASTLTRPGSALTMPPHDLIERRVTRTPGEGPGV